ncbi:2,6-dihydropseudooxynicotine hydrolase [compost metagenome]
MDFTDSIIEKTIMSSFLYEPFWDRWVGSGISKATVYELRQQANSIEDWIEILQCHVEVYEQLALKMLKQHLDGEAEYFYRIAAMNYSLIQWMFPHAGPEKQAWYERCQDMHRQADRLAAETVRAVILVEGNECYGRIRIPRHPRGCIIMVNPIDSSKEESIKYEAGFARLGFVTVSFDGPGQGETYVLNRYKATWRNWELFVHEITEYAVLQFPELPLYLFGTSFGATWAIKGGSHPGIRKVVAVSPLIEDQTRWPEYFQERLSYVIEGEENPLAFREEKMGRLSALLLIHGKQDDWVKDAAIESFYQAVPAEKRLIEYIDERHGCNFKMDDIIASAADWYMAR